MKTNVYVDGFNLYYGCIKGTPYKWLNLAKLCQLLLPNDEIQKIKYYTATVSARPHDPDQPVRQQAYIRALRTLPNLEVIYGHFLSHEVTMIRADSKPNKPRYVQVMKTEEKGSDVNLASHIIHDGHLRDYELAVIVSNDSDLAEPIRIVTQQLGLKVGVLNPHKHPSKTLISNALFHKNIRSGVLKNCLFPSTLTDANGTFHKPANW